MSQIYKAVSSTNLPSNVPTIFHTVNGNATPVANTITFTGIGGAFSASGSTVTFTVTSTGFTWNDVSGAFVSAPNNGYFVFNMSTTTLPVGAQGNTIEFIVDTALSSALVITAGAGQKIRIGTSVSSVNGTATSNALGSTVELIFRASDSTWIAGDNNGTWSLV